MGRFIRLPRKRWARKDFFLRGLRIVEGKPGVGRYFRLVFVDGRRDEQAVF